MKIGIIGAMEEEIRELKRQIEEQTIIEHLGNVFVEGKLHGKEVVLVQSGIGKVNATITVVLLKQLFEVDYIINTGSAGALDSALEVGELIIAHSLAYHDVDVTGFGYKAGQMAGMPEEYYPDTYLLRTAQAACRAIDIEPAIGLVVSGDQFVNSSIQKENILRYFPNARAVEMESTAIAQAAYVMAIPFVIIRAVSDDSDGEAPMTFDQFIIAAGRISAEMVSRTIAML